MSPGHASAPNSTETRWQRWLRSLLYGRNVDRDVKAVSYTHLTLPTNREV